MRVLHVIPTNGIGGVPVVLKNLIQSMPDIEHYVFGEIENDGLNFEGVAVNVFNGKSREFSIETFLYLVKIISKFKIDIVHSHGKGPGFYSRVMKLMVGVKVVHTYHGFHNRFVGLYRIFYMMFEKLAAKNTDYIVALSESERIEIIKKLGLKDNDARLVIVPNFFITYKNKRYSKVELNKFVIGSVGRMSPQKNQKLILKIAEEFLGDDNVLFVLIGGGALEDAEYYKEVLLEVDQKKLNNVKCLGPINDVSSHLGGFDLYLSTSRWEGLPTVILEAFDFGIPVVASNCIGNVDLVNGQTGELVDGEDPQSYVNSINRIRSLTEKKLKAITKAQNDLLTSTYSHDSVYTKLRSIYLN